MTVERGAPDTTTPDDSVFWIRARDGELVFQHCTGCGFVRWPAAGACPECLGRGFVWSPVEPVGTVWSWVVYHRAYAPALREQVPYDVALVELDCGVRLLTRLTGFADGQDPVGARVRAAFAEIGTAGTVPLFGPEDPAPAIAEAGPDEEVDRG